MACFIVPAAEAVVTTIVEKKLKNREIKMDADMHLEGTVAEKTETETTDHIPFSKKLSWLNRMLWGGCVLLLLEHVWHGEVVPWFPFLTAMSSEETTSEMLHEMSTVGVTMAVVVTAVWGIMCGLTYMIEKKAEKFAGSEE